ncbi:MAG: 1-acyl-sn-glycerol-3-phosphate acyltransferase [Candidatus Rokubacteria bacterium]|nr:1-acyl-sn-glycerol-3-phosphate acyltransferase [Candidatus Rokubacteria bacterium]
MSNGLRGAAPPAPARMDRFYAAVRAVARFWLWFFFKAADVRHADRVPATGPVLLCINHPNNLIDSLLVGAVLPRKVHYLATAALFKNALVARLLDACGVIPVYRKDDDVLASRSTRRRTASPSQEPSAGGPAAGMDRNVDTFAACWAAFDRGRVIAIYPEGTTHAETRVQRIKTGAARIALDYEARAPGRLAVVPVGLSFEARKAFRGRVLVSFGEPVPVAPYIPAWYREPAKAVDALTTAIQWAMERQVVHVERIETAAVARAVEEIYRGELERELRDERGLAPRQIDPFRLARSIADAVEHFREREPERVEQLWQRLQTYRALLAAYRLRDETVRARATREPVRRLAWSWRAVAGLPLFAYGALVNLLPYLVPRWLARRMARKETDYATIRLLASVVAFPVFWSLETWLVWQLAGVRWALAFLASLPVTGLIAYRYQVGAGRLRRQLRFGAWLLTHRQEARRLLAERQAILEELERAKRDYLAATKGSSF